MWPVGKKLEGYMIDIISVHEPDWQHVGESWPLARLQVLQNRGSLMVILRLKVCQREKATSTFKRV